MRAGKAKSGVQITVIRKQQGKFSIELSLRGRILYFEITRSR